MAVFKKLSAVVVIASGLVYAQPESRDMKWGKVAKLALGANVKLSMKDSAGKLKGKFISSDQDGVSVMLSDGTSRTIARSNVREILASSKSLQRAPFIRGAVGATLMGVAASRPRFDLVKPAVVLCAGVGTAIGFGMGMGFRYSILYEAP